MKYTRENIVEGIKDKLIRLTNNDPNREPFRAGSLEMMRNYPIEIEQNILEWINDELLTEIDCGGVSVKHVMYHKNLSDIHFPIVVRNFSTFKKHGFVGTAVCYWGL